MTKQGKVVLIVAIVGACCVGGVTIVLLLAALAIPAMQATIRHTNETSAINTLKFLTTEQQNYNATYPEHGFSCSLSAMGGSPQSGPETAEAAQLIGADVAAGRKAGYAFAISNCVKQKDQVISYKLTAVPVSPGHTGTRGFRTDQDGQITVDPNGGVNCTQPLQ